MMIKEVMINPCRFLPFHVYQISFGLERGVYFSRWYTWKRLGNSSWKGKIRCTYVIFQIKYQVSLQMTELGVMERTWLKRNRNKNNGRDWWILQLGGKNPLRWQAKEKISAGINAINLPDTGLISSIYKEILWKTGKKAKWKLKK